MNLCTHASVNMQPKIFYLFS